MGKLSLYVNTVRYMKPSQIWYRLVKMAGGTASGLRVGAVQELHPIVTAEELDFDPVFLERFPVEALMRGKMPILHHTEDFSWEKKWDFPACTPLWNYNLHYMEYLFSLAAAYRNTGEREYLSEIEKAVSGWIRQNPMKDGGNGWSAYTISLRLAVWLELYSLLSERFTPEFRSSMVESIHEQYEFLARHPEKDLLGNHYFEDLKTLVLCALFFDDTNILELALKRLLEQCREQILSDGLHFELSPMYHKIILEDVLRVSIALRGAGKPCAELEGYLQSMVDGAFSMEKGLDRLPLFNDCGTNVSKSLPALLACAEHHFDIHPAFRTEFPEAGYYIFQQGPFRLIVDAGKPGPEYLPGHAHCDCMSFELFRDGTPVVVNCGTYAYQDEKRSFFRSTAAHNTVMSGDTEQSCSWGAFRMACRARILDVQMLPDGIFMEMRDQKGNPIRRTLHLSDSLLDIKDEGRNLRGFLHVQGEAMEAVETEGSRTFQRVPYAEEFGRLESVQQISLTGAHEIRWKIHLDRLKSDI